jgi:hypothetical protein
MAEAGRFDDIAFDDVIPGYQIGLGRPQEPRFDRVNAPMRDEPRDGFFPAGSIVLVDDGNGVAVGPWMVTWTARPDLAGTATRIGRVVQNLDGVVRRLQPGDRILSISVYEGDGTEPLPTDDDDTGTNTPESTALLN